MKPARGYQCMAFEKQLNAENKFLLFYLYTLQLRIRTLAVSFVATSEVRKFMQIFYC